MTEQYYSVPEMVVVETSKFVKDEMVIFVGIGLGLLTASLAVKTHAPRATILMEGGTVDSRFAHLPFSVCEPRSAYGCTVTTGLFDILGYDAGGGHADMAILGAAQVDQYGNLNSSMGARQSGEPFDVLHPGWRATGSGGANDAASGLPFVVNIVHQDRRFPKVVDYLTSPGWMVKEFEKGEVKWVPRKEAGLTRGGPVAIVTTQCIMKFDEKTKEMYLDSVHPKVTVDEVKNNTSWDLKVAKEVKQTEPPTVEEIRMVREELDPFGIYLKREEFQKKAIEFLMAK